MKRTATRFLAILCDVLLPKIHSGEIRITETGNIVGAIS